MITVQLDGLVLHIDTALEAAQLIGALRPVPEPRSVSGSTLTPTPLRRTKHAAKPAPARGTKASLTAAVQSADRHTEAADRVRVFLRGKPTQPLAVVLAGARCSHAQLKRLVSIGVVVGTGATLSRRYSLPAATSAASAAKASAHEVVWNGTKDAKGEAPSLSSYATKRSA